MNHSMNDTICMFVCVSMTLFVCMCGIILEHSCCDLIVIVGSIVLYIPVVFM